MKTWGLVLSIICLAISQANAGTSASNFQSTASVSSACTLTGGSISFGNVGIGAGATKASGTMTVLCSGGIAYDLIFSPGNSGNQLQRTMKGQASNDTLNYNIYTDTTYTTIIGDETGGTNHPLTGALSGRPIANGMTAGRNAYVSTGRTVLFDIYGQIPDGQYVTPDTYLDNLTITVNY